MRRGFWFTAGAATGVYGMVKVRRLVETFTPDGMRDRVGAAFAGARVFREEFAQGMADAETDLRERYRMAATGRHRELEEGLDTPSPGGSGDSTNLEGDSTDLEGDSTDLGGDSTSLGGDSTNLEGDSTDLERTSTNERDDH